MFLHARLRFLWPVVLAAATVGVASANQPTRVEIKVSLPAVQVRKALRALGLSQEKAAREELYFFDTKSLELFHSGVLLRARQKGRAVEDDSTIKIRPLRPSAVQKHWFQQNGFKCEYDRSRGISVPSCSLTEKQSSGEIDDVVHGHRSIRHLYSRLQEDFLAEYSKWGGDWSRPRVLGPVTAFKWKVKVKEFDDPLSVELWQIPNGDRILEVSIRVPFYVVAPMEKRLEALMIRFGLDALEKREMKSEFALNYFASQLRD